MQRSPLSPLISAWKVSLLLSLPCSCVNPSRNAAHWHERRRLQYTGGAHRSRIPVCLNLGMGRAPPPPPQHHTHQPAHSAAHRHERLLGLPPPRVNRSLSLARVCSTHVQRVRSRTVEPRIRPKGGFGLTPGKLLTLRKPNPYPKSVSTPAQKLRKNLNLWNPLGRFGGEG